MTRMVFTWLLAGAALTLCWSLPAQAKRVPNDRVPLDSSVVADDAVIYDGPVGAMLEANYFHARRPDAAPASLCRLQLYFSSNDLRFARSCD